MPTALITGMAGFVGSHLADHLLENTDWDIVGFNRWNDSMDNIRHLFGRINAGGRVKLIHGDLRDVASVHHAVRESHPSYVFHLAAQSYPQTSFTAPADTLETNVQGTLHVLEAVRQYTPQAWVLNCSSSEVYGKVAQENVPITEGCPFHPASPYAISKVGADLLGQHYAEAYGLNVVTTRMFTHTGPRRGDVFHESSFAKQIVMCEAGLIDRIKVGNLSSLRTYADVRDAVRAYHMALTVLPHRGMVFNIGGGHTCTVDETLHALMDIAGQRYVFEADGERMRPIDADMQVPDCTRFKHHTGWEPAIPFEKTMTDLLQYWRDQAARHGEFLAR